jgi:hypothetical protein
LESAYLLWMMALMVGEAAGVVWVMKGRQK